MKLSAKRKLGRRHHNNTGLRGIKAGHRADEMELLAQKLEIEFKTAGHKTRRTKPSPMPSALGTVAPHSSEAL